MVIKKKVLATLALALLLSGPATYANASVERSGTEAVDDALDLYWGKTQVMTALQRRNNPRDFRHEFTIYSGVLPNEGFFSFYPVGGRYNFFFLEDYGVEAWGAYMLKANSELKTFLQTTFSSAVLGDVPSTIEFMAGLDFVWTPIHGKFAIFASKLTHFDVYLAIGPTFFGTKAFIDGVETQEMKIGGHLGIGIRLFLTDFLALRLGYHQHFYGATGGASSTPAEFNMGVSFWTPADE